MSTRFPALLAARPATEVFLAAVFWILSVVGVEAFDRQVAASSGGAGKLDLLWGYDVATVIELFGRYGEIGRGFYVASTWMDMVFPLALAMFAILLLTRAGFRSPIWMLPPVGFLILDVIENGCLLRLVSEFPVVSEPLVRIASAFTQAKLALLAPTYVSMLVALSVVVWRWSRSLWCGAGVVVEPVPTTQRTETVALASVGLALGLFLTPIQSAIWNQAQTAAWIAALSWPVLIAHFTIPDAYAVFGKLFVCVPIALIGTLDAIRATDTRLVAHPALRILLGLLCLAVVADVGTYWIAGLEDPGLRFYTFWCGEVPIWLMIAGTGSWFGFSRGAREAGLDVWILRGLPLTMLGGAALFEYLPHGLVLPFAASAFVLAIRNPGRVRLNNRSRHPSRSHSPVDGEPSASRAATTES